MGKGPRRSAASAPFITWLPVFAVLVPLSMLLGAGWLTWHAALTDAKAGLRRSAEAGAEYGTRTLQGYVASTGRMNERLRGLSDETITGQELHLHNELRLLIAEDAQAEAAFVVDRAGRALVSTSIYPLPRDLSLADREYYLALARTGRPEIHVSEPYVGRLDDRLLFSVTRPRTGSGNPPVREDGFDGLVSLAVDPNVLAAGLRRVAEPDGVLSLVRQEGDILSRSAGQTRKLPRVPPESPFHSVVRAEAQSGVYEATNFTGGGEEVLVAVHRLQGFPVYAVALRPRAAIMAQWRGRLAGHLVFGVPATVGLLLLSLRVRADHLRLSAANASLEKDVERGAARLSRAAEMGLIGTFEFDLRTGVSARSGEYMSVAGYAAVPATERHEDWVRRLHPDDRERAESYLRQALSDTSGVVNYAQSYRIITPQGETRWVAARGEVERDAAGRALILRGAHVDVTPLRETQLALAESDARLRLAQEAVGIGTWEWFPAGRRLTWSNKMIELWGFDPAHGQPPLREALARLHPLDRARLRREMALAHRSGQLRTELRIMRPRADREPELTWLVVRARLLPGSGHGALGGAGKRLVGVAYDVSERKAAEEHAALLAHEVEHRAKNMITVIAGLVRVTRADTHEAYVQTLSGRIQALAGTLSLLGDHDWRGTTLGELLRRELEPFIAGQEGRSARATLAGPDFLVDAEVAQLLSIAIHELTTNAAKYGALSDPNGHLEVLWTTGEGVVEVTWRETGGPPLAGPPASTSFGSQLITHSITKKLGGEITQDWLPEGLVCRLRFPLGGQAAA